MQPFKQENKNFLGAMIRGGQTGFHTLRMAYQVISNSLLTGVIITLVLLVVIVLSQIQKNPLIYKKAVYFAYAEMIEEFKLIAKDHKPYINIENKRVYTKSILNDYSYQKSYKYVKNELYKILDKVILYSLIITLLIRIFLDYL